MRFSAGTDNAVGSAPVESQQVSSPIRSHVSRTRASKRIVCRTTDNLTVSRQLDDAIPAFVIVIDEFLDGESSRLFLRNQIRKHAA